MERMRVAIAGAGAISEFHLRGWAAQDDVTLVAICDPDRARAEARAAAFGVPAVFEDAATMLDAARPDALDVITPVSSHAALTLMAAERGVHVMCQKPMTPTVAEAEALIAAVGERVRFMVHENYRFRPHYAQVRDWVAEGRVGAPRHVRLTVRSSSMVAYPGAVPFLLNRQPYLADFPRLLTFEVLIHHIDALRAILGEMTVESATLDRLSPDLKGEDVALITLRAASGALVAIDANISALGYPPLPTDRLEIVGDRDTLVLDRERLCMMSDPDAPVIHDLAANYQACFTAAIASFVTGLRDGTPLPTDRLDNLRTLKLMEAVYRAAGVPVG